MTTDGDRVALLSNPKPAQRLMPLYVACESKDEAIEYFKLTYSPLPEPEPEN